MKNERGFDEEGGWEPDDEWEPSGEPYEISLVRNFDGNRWSAWVKWDGCVHFDVKSTHENGDGDFYWHVCDLAEVIKALTDLREEAVRHYTKTRKRWPDY